MSAPVLDSVRTPVELPTAESASGINFIAIVRRRWPWVLVGLLVGIVGGLLAYSARPAVYQSSSQLLISKKNVTGTLGQNPVGYLEDYMATQTSIIKSEPVRMAAARAITPEMLRGSFPTEPADRAKFFEMLMGVAREKDPTNPMILTNVLNISMKGANPDDCQALLKVLIDAYKSELSKIQEGLTLEKLELLRQAIDRNTKINAENIKQKNDAMNSITERTSEDIALIRARFSKMIELNYILKQEQIELTKMLDLIRTVEKSGKRERADVLDKLNQQNKIPQLNSFSPRTIDPNNPIVQRYELEAQMEELKKKYGKDHPLIEQIQARLSYLRNLQIRLNPGENPDDERDGLSRAESFLKYRREAIVDVMKEQEATIAEDNLKLKAILPKQNMIEAMDKVIADRNKLIDQYELEKTTTELTRASGGYDAKSLIEPTREATPIAPKLSQNLLLGAAAGLLFGIGLAALAELSDKGFRSPADIRARLGLPVIGHIPPIRTNLPPEPEQAGIDIEPTIVTALRPKSVEAEAYRGVRTALYFNAAGSTHQMIQVTSPNQGDGKSTLAANLAVSIAQSGKRVLLVDCDMRRPRVHRVFHLPEPGPGLAAVIQGGVSLSQAIKSCAIENLSILPCGKKPANPAELLTSPNFSDLLDRLKSDYDFVILDTPPVLAVSDPSAVAPRADGVILVFRMSSKVRPMAERAREQLAQIGANVIGVVVNGSGRSNDGSYGNYGGYGNEYTGYTHENQYLDNYAEDGQTSDGELPKKG